MRATTKPLKKTKDGVDWDGMWTDDLKPGELWDCQETELMLEDMIKSGLIPPLSSALVPGCGRGYAIASFVRAGYKNVVGIEISPAAAKIANDFVASSLYGDKDTSSSRESKDTSASSFSIINTDFFNLPEEHNGAYDLVYDSTFLCAIQPGRRLEWATVMKKVLKPGGILVQNIYPSAPRGSYGISLKDDPGMGPPFLLSLRLSQELLEPHGFMLVSAEYAPKEKLSRINNSKNSDEVWAIHRSPLQDKSKV